MVFAPGEGFRLAESSDKIVLAMRVMDGIFSGTIKHSLRSCIIKYEHTHIYIHISIYLFIYI